MVTGPLTSCDRVQVTGLVSCRKTRIYLINCTHLPGQLGRLNAITHLGCPAQCPPVPVPPGHRHFSAFQHFHHLATLRSDMMGCLPFHPSDGFLLSFMGRVQGQNPKISKGCFRDSLGGCVSQNQIYKCATKPGERVPVLRHPEAACPTSGPHFNTIQA